MLDISRFSAQEVNELMEAVSRYYYYIDTGIPEGHISEFQDMWAENVLSLVPQSAGGALLEEIYDELVQLRTSPPRV